MKQANRQSWSGSAPPVGEHNPQAERCVCSDCDKKREPFLVLHWEHKETGATGHGEPLDHDLAYVWLDHFLATDPTCNYWLE